MFRFLVITLLASLGQTGYAADNFSFQCVSSMPTTSFLLKQEKDKTVLTVIHHNGTKFMPIHEGIVVPNDLKYLQEKSEILTKMGDRIEFTFPVANCRKTTEGVISCFGGSREVRGGWEMEAMRITTSKVSEVSSYGNFEHNRVTLTLHVHGFAPIQDLSIYYFDKECKFE